MVRFPYFEPTKPSNYCKGTVNTVCHSNADFLSMQCCCHFISTLTVLYTNKQTGIYKTSFVGTSFTSLGLSKCRFNIIIINFIPATTHQAAVIYYKE